MQALRVCTSRQIARRAYHRRMIYTDWDAMREKCQACKHRLVQNDARQDKPGTIWRCAASPVRGRGRFAYCIDARDGGKCGEDATMYEAADVLR